MEQVDASIARYLRALDRADREEGDVAEAKSVRLKEKIAGLRRQMQALKVMEQTVQDAPDQQVSLTDPDARSMATSGKGTAHRRLQCADRRRRRAPSDRGPRGDQSGPRPNTSSRPWRSRRSRRRAASRSRPWPTAATSTATRFCRAKAPASRLRAQDPDIKHAKRGLFTGQDFIYDAEKDHYTCPAGQN